MSEFDVGLLGFVTDLTYEEVPGEVRQRLRLLLLDLMAVSAAGRPAPAARIATDTAAVLFGGDAATAWLDGTPMSVAGAAFANGVLANVLDHDDGHPLTKGHPGAVVIPAAAAVAQAVRATAEEFLLAVLIGYEVAIRAGIEQHARRPQYHGSGSWGALGAAAAAARLLKLGPDLTRQALGLAEYHAPISLIMRSVAEPAMTKDAIAWGAHTGVTAAYLARAGFTGTESEFGAAGERDWGARWHVLDLYVKPYPCCRWAQPAVRAASDLIAGTGPLRPELVRSVEIRTFAAAAALAGRPPRSTEEAQYSLRWPVACLLAHGRFGVPQVLGGFDDPATLEMMQRIQVVVDPVLSERFPGERLSSVSVGLTDGTVRAGSPVTARGDVGDPAWDDLVREKAVRYLGAFPEADIDRPAVGTWLATASLIEALAAPYETHEVKESR
jgi:2-methylcitrate dehydratase PrpD